MKTKKFIYGLLPLFLIMSACSGSNIQPGSSEQPAPSSSGESSSEAPSSSSSEEPPVPPEERERQAREELNRVLGLLDGGDYVINMSGYYSDGAKYYYSDDFYYAYTLYMNDYGYTNEKGFGYYATSDGVMVIKTADSYSEEPAKCVGYTKKTSSLEESKEIVKSLSIQFTIDPSDWTYVSNDGETSLFATRNNDVFKLYAKLDNLHDYDGLYDAVYLKIFNGQDSIRLTPDIKDNDIQFSSAVINDFGKAKEQPIIVDALKEANAWTENRWYDTSMSGQSRIGELPFPSLGTKEYFVYYGRGDGRYDHCYELKIGFIDTGDITEQYVQDLNVEGYSWDPCTTNPKYYFREFRNIYSDDSSSPQYVEGLKVKLSYTEPTANYPKGIFYIETDTTSFPQRQGYRFEDEDLSNNPGLYMLPFPNDGVRHVYYSVNHITNNDFDVYFSDLVSEYDYGQQLVDAGYDYDETEHNYTLQYDMGDRYETLVVAITLQYDNVMHLSCTYSITLHD